MSDTDTRVEIHSETSDALDFDLRPPPPRPKPPSVESLSDLLFSSGHLDVLLHSPQDLARFTAFLGKYRLQYHPALLKYLETQKAIKAVEYANAVAEGIQPTQDQDSSTSALSRAAVLDEVFEEANTSAFRLLVDSALPTYITYNMVKLVTECLISEITGRQTSLTRGLVGGLSEVFCLTDPNQEDNPIIYASEEFYRLTGYGPDDVIGHNCRFLQGSKTRRESVSRLRDSIRSGEEICETLLNYRRDGRAFINLLMIAPLHDDKGNVKYHIGAQVDVTGLIERGKGLDAFERFVINQAREQRSKTGKEDNDRDDDQGLRKPRALAKLRELSEMFDLEESAVVRSHSRSTSGTRDDDERSVGSSRRSARRVFRGESSSSDDGDSNNSDGDSVNEDRTWKLASSGRSGLSGKLPGVYDSYMLIRAAPSLRIIFVSPKLRRRFGDIIQHPFLSHVAAPSHTLSGLKESFEGGVPVSAKVGFMLTPGQWRDGTITNVGAKQEDSERGRICWIAATPLLGSDDTIGVWMIVVVEKAKVPVGNIRRGEGDEALNQKTTSPKPSKAERPGKIDIPVRTFSHRQLDSGSVLRPDTRSEDMPIKPKRLEEGPQFTGYAHPRSESPQEEAQHFGNGTGKDSDERGAVNQEYALAVANTVQNSEAVVDGPISDEHGTINANAQDSSNIFQSLSDDEDTPKRARHPGCAIDTTSPSRSGTSRTVSPSSKPNSKHYMDYLRHPGSRPSSEYDRTVSGSGLLSVMYHGETGERNVEDIDDDFNDLECAMSPYSVD